MKRFFDIFSSVLVLLLFFIPFVIIAFFILLESKGGILYRQVRVGKGNKDFNLLKFRTMYPNSDKKGLLTIGTEDTRITRTGKVLRRFKLDEFPQLLNIITGDMSIVGPRPEVRKYVDMYNERQLKVLTVRPGLTDYASIEYINENEILAKESDPEAVYIQKIMPEKLELNLRYIETRSFWVDLKIIFKTIGRILK